VASSRTKMHAAPTTEDTIRCSRRGALLLQEMSIKTPSKVNDIFDRAVHDPRHAWRALSTPTSSASGNSRERRLRYPCPTRAVPVSH
jgi:hypothetical protein